jgi:hypothetical protein
VEPRNERNILDRTRDRGDDYVDDILPLNTNSTLSLLEENARLRRLVVELSSMILRNVADQR